MVGRRIRIPWIVLLLVLFCGLGMGVFALFFWMLALNGFIGQDRAVNSSMAVFATMTIGTIVTTTILSYFSVRYLIETRGWHRIVAALLVGTLYITLSGGTQLAAVIVSAVVAEEMRIKR